MASHNTPREQQNHDHQHEDNNNVQRRAQENDDEAINDQVFAVLFMFASVNCLGTFFLSFYGWKIIIVMIKIEH